MAHLNKSDYVITLTVTMRESILGYFSHARKALQTFEAYTKRHRELDFMRMRRFLRTTFKTLQEVDTEFMAEKLSTLHHNVDNMALIYDDFVTKSNTAMHSYEVIFLQRQEHFSQFETLLEHNAGEISYLREQTERFKESVAEEKNRLKKTPGFLRDDAKEEALKRLKRKENAAIVRLGEIIEENIILSEVLREFRETYEEQFVLMFNKYTQNLRPELLSILNAMAFEFDVEMWIKANESEIIRSYFKNAYAGDVISSKTYLSYYLKGLDHNKLNEEHKQLQKLLEYLNETTPIHCVMYMPSEEDLERFELALNADDSGFVMHCYTDAKIDLSQAFKTRIDVLILDLESQENILENFLSLYQKNSQHLNRKAKIMLVTSVLNDASIAKAEMLGADSIIDRGVDAFEIIDTVYDLLKVDIDDIVL